MSKDIMTFRRVEKKYRIDVLKKQMLLSLISHRLVPDSHGKSTISSVYLDTPSRLLIRNSIDARTYKEKLRIRSYGVPKPSDRVFLEIKKKYKGVVYKRREAMPLSMAEKYIETLEKPFDSQIMRELDYAMHFYRYPKPSMVVSYDREAYFVEDMPGLRITFDNRIRWREQELFLSYGNGGRMLLPENEYVLEIKTGGAMPLWLSCALDECKIYPTSFSKYGRAYLSTLCNNEIISTEKGENKHVCTV